MIFQHYYLLTQKQQFNNHSYALSCLDNIIQFFQLFLLNILYNYFLEKFYNSFTSSMSTKDFKCPLCQLQYNKQLNIPRLLTMCGHTYCEKCVKSLIVKKKDMKYKICCPEDNCSLQFPSGNPAYFPKNLALLQVINKNKKTSIMGLPQESFDISYIQQIHSNEILIEGDVTGKQFLQIIGELEDKKIPNLLEDKNSSAIFSDKNIFMENDDSDFCLGHQKAKDVICLDHMKKICASCAIFGQHQGHTFKSITQVEKISDQYALRFHNLIQIKQNYQKCQTQKRQFYEQAANKLNQKASTLKKQMSQFYTKLFQMIKKSEKQTLQQIQKIVTNTLNKLSEVLNSNQDIINAYNKWESIAKLHLKILQSYSIEQKCQIVFGKRSKINEISAQGQQLSSHTKIQEKTAYEEYSKLIDRIELKIDQDILRAIQSCAYIKIVQQEQNKLIFLRRNKSENFLQPKYTFGKKSNNYFTPLQEELLQQSIILQQKQQQTQKNIIHKVSSELVCKTFRKVSQVETDQQKTLVIDQKTKNLTKNKTVSSVSPMPIVTDRITFTNHSKKHSLSFLKIPDKYEKLMKFGKEIQQQYIDITNANVPQNVLLQIISKLPKDTKIKCLKLSRNNITDRFLEKIIDRLGGVISLNLSQNFLSDHSLKLIANKLIHLPNLKILNLSQNKIVERRNKNLIDQMRSHGLTLTI